MATSVTLKPNAIDISGSTSGTTTLQASAVAGTTTLTLPAATDTLVGKATTDTLTNKTLTGAAMNGTLGATTPSTASITTLTTSSTVTHSGGTANGVAYLDGSKVLTTGSALVFDGTNLGLGITPSAWSGVKAIEIASAGSGIYSFGATDVRVTGNAYWNGSAYKYGNTNLASMYVQNAGIHYWYNAASGTAGNSITWTQAMTLDASGNLIVGGTSPTTSSGYTSLSINNATNSGYVVLQNNGTNKSDWFVSSGTVATLRGVAVPLSFEATGANYVKFETNGSERARITSGGYFKASNAGSYLGSTSAYHELDSDADNSTVVVRNTNSTFTSDIVQARPTRNTTNGSFKTFSYYNEGAGAFRFQVLDSGNVQNTNNSYGAISDAKLKENIVDTSPKLNDLMQVRVRNFNFKDDQTHKQIGVIAQELEQVFPALVEEFVDRDAEGNDLGTTTKSVKYSVFVPMLIKAIQEQQAIIQSLTARITALENK